MNVSDFFISFHNTRKVDFLHNFEKFCATCGFERIQVSPKITHDFMNITKTNHPYPLKVTQKTYENS